MKLSRLMFVFALCVSPILGKYKYNNRNTMYTTHKPHMYASTKARNYQEKQNLKFLILKFIHVYKCKNVNNLDDILFFKTIPGYLPECSEEKKTEIDNLLFFYECLCVGVVFIISVIIACNV